MNEQQNNKRFDLGELIAISLIIAGLVQMV